jgi:hypothetical protein
MIVEIYKISYDNWSRLVLVMETFPISEAMHFRYRKHFQNHKCFQFQKLCTSDIGNISKITNVSNFRSYALPILEMFPILETYLLNLEWKRFQLEMIPILEMTRTEGENTFIMSECRTSELIKDHITPSQVEHAQPSLGDKVWLRHRGWQFENLHRT